MVQESSRRPFALFLSFGHQEHHVIFPEVNFSLILAVTVIDKQAHIKVIKIVGGAQISILAKLFNAQRMAILYFE